MFLFLRRICAKILIDFTKISENLLKYINKIIFVLNFSKNYFYIQFQQKMRFILPFVEILKEIELSET